MKIPSGARPNRHTPVETTRRPLNYQYLTLSKERKELWGDIKVYQKYAGCSIISTTHTFESSSAYVHVEKVLRLLKWELSYRLEHRLKKKWAIVKSWDIDVLTADQAAAFHEKLADVVMTWKQLARDHENIAPCKGVALAEVPDRLGANEQFKIPNLVEDHKFVGVVLPVYQTVNEFFESSGYSHSVSALPLLIDIAKALQYLHSLDPPVVHGGIKEANVLITEGPKALLTDIGMINLPFPLSPEAGRWMAPELLSTLAPKLFNFSGVKNAEDMKKNRVFKATRASDVYSFGLLTVEMITRKRPFHNLDHLSINELIGFRKINPVPLQKPEGFPELNDVVWGIVEQCVEYNPAKRPDMNAVVAFLEISMSYTSTY